MASLLGKAIDRLTAKKPPEGWPTQESLPTIEDLPARERDAIFNFAGPGLGVMAGITPAARAAKFEKLLFTPARKALYDKAKKAMELILNDPQYTSLNPEHGYLIGSFPSAKPNPGDIDLLLQFAGGPGTPPGIQNFTKMHAITSVRPSKGWGIVGGEKESDFLRTIFNNAKEKYGPDYKWIKVLGLAPLASTSLLGNKPDEPDEQGYGRYPLGP